LAGFIIASIFVFVAYLSQTYSEDLNKLLNGNNLFVGMIIFFILTVIATVFAPASTLPLIPVASVLWGPFATGLLAIVSWTTGSMIAFGIAKKYGRPLVGRFVNTEKIDAMQHRLSDKNIFFTVLFLRLSVPVDILSYALGLFAKINWKTHASATFIGVAPFAFVFSYSGALPIQYQVGALLLAGFVMLVAIFYFKRI